MKRLLTGALFLCLLSGCMTLEDQEQLEAQGESVSLLKYKLSKLTNKVDNLQERQDRDQYWRDMKRCGRNTKCRQNTRHIWRQLWLEHGN